MYSHRRKLKLASGFQCQLEGHFRVMAPGKFELYDLQL
jgi:hypothetical protein